MNKIYVGNLPFDTTEDELQQFFASDSDSIVGINIITDRRTGRSKGFAFIELNSSEAMDFALKKDGEELQGRKLKVNEAREKSRES